MALRLDGTNPLSHMGVTPQSLAPDFTFNRAPTFNDVRFNLMTRWLDQSSSDVYVLVSLSKPSINGLYATWIRYTGNTGVVISLTGNDGIIVPADINGNINVVGDGTYLEFTGDIATNTLTGNLFGVLLTVTGDAGVPVLPDINGNINIIAGQSTRNSGSSVQFFGDTITLTLNVTDSLNNTLIGQGCGGSAMTIAQNNTGIGAACLNALITGDFNNGHGILCLSSEASGSNNCAYGNSSMTTANGSSNNSAYGNGSLGNLLDGTNNLALGYNSASNLSSNSSSCIHLLNTGSNGDNNLIRIGTDGTGLGQQNLCFIAGNVHGARGFTADTGDVTLTDAAGNINLPPTNGTGTQGVITVHDIPMGIRVPVISWRGESNTFIGGNAGNFTLTVLSSINNTACGADSLQQLTTGANNTCLGKTSGQNITTGNFNTSAGVLSLSTANSASQNTTIGFQAGKTISTSFDNVALGAYALDAFSTGAANAGANTALGTNSLGALLTGIQNCCVGDSCAANLLTGSFNLILGPSGAGSNYTGAESSNILINNDGVTGESNVIRIGNQGSGDDQQDTCFIAGIRGSTTGVNNAIAVLIDSAGQLGTVSSSKRFKENIQDMAYDSSKIMDLRPVTFNYKNDSSQSKQFGLIAEEVSEVFPELTVYDKEGPFTVKYHELPSLLLNEIQRLNRRIEHLEKLVLH